MPTSARGPRNVLDDEGRPAAGVRHRVRQARRRQRETVVCLLNDLGGLMRPGRFIASRPEERCLRLDRGLDGRELSMRFVDREAPAVSVDETLACWWSEGEAA